MIVSKIYLGYTDKRSCCHLLRVGLYNRSLRKISDDLDLKTGNLSSFTKTLEDLSSQKKAFFIREINKNKKKNSKDLVIKENNYYLFLMERLYNKSFNNRKFLKKIDDLTDFDYKYVVYIGYKNSEIQKEKDSSNPTVMSVFKLKNNFIASRGKYFSFSIGKHSINISKNMGSSNLPSINVVSNLDSFQLPCDKSSNIANFYQNNTDIELYVYSPIEFDSIFNTQGIRKEFAAKTFKKFDKKKILITTDGISVSFVKIFNDPKSKIKILNNTKRKVKILDDTKNVKNQVSSNDNLIDNMAQFTGNKNSTIERINWNELFSVLHQLHKDVHDPNVKCDFREKDIPIVYVKKNRRNKKNKTMLLVTVNSISMFCSLLMNKLIKRVLTETISD